MKYFNKAFQVDFDRASQVDFIPRIKGKTFEGQKTFTNISIPLFYIPKGAELYQKPNVFRKKGATKNNFKCVLRFEADTFYQLALRLHVSVRSCE